jgi:hypothetical protein
MASVAKKQGKAKKKNKKARPTSYKKGRKQLKKMLDRYTDDFVKHGEEKHQENMWEYARLNPTSDKRIF